MLGKWACSLCLLPGDLGGDGGGVIVRGPKEAGLLIKAGKGRLCQSMSRFCGII